VENVDSLIGFMFGDPRPREAALNLAASWVERNTKLFNTRSENTEQVQRVIDLFFDENYDVIVKELRLMDFDAEIEDLYLNIRD